MIVDIHTHITGRGFPELRRLYDRKTFSARTLLMRMDMEGIDKSLILPIVNPENADNLGLVGNRECISACRKHSDRLVPFCNIDPRGLWNTPRADFSGLIRVYKSLGCKGIGEMCANLPITHPLYKNLFHHAGLQNMPVLFHLTAMRRGMYGAIDKFHLPGLEEVLGEFPDTVFIGHAPAFWNEIDGNLSVKDREEYPSTPIRKKGRVQKLFAAYPNLYGDLSAGSGYNAVSRDPEVGYRFMQKFNRRLFFGTDRFESKDEPIPPILPFMKKARRTGKITNAAFENIMHRNYERVLDKGGR